MPPHRKAVKRCASLYMNLLKTIRAFFYKPSQQTSSYNVDAYIAKHMTEIYVDAEALIKKYGADFYSFLYRPDIDTIIRQEIIPFKYPGSKNINFLDYDHWLKKHPFNFPGPFYTGESDTCGTGDSEAPNNVMYDEYCCEYIFKQPQTFAEFLCVVDAAAVEVFDSYSCDGNTHWTYQKCKEWWRDKTQILNELTKPEIRKVNGERLQLYFDYLNDSAELDLRKYCFFLENGSYPTDNVRSLPEL